MAGPNGPRPGTPVGKTPNGTRFQGVFKRSCQVSTLRAAVGGEKGESREEKVESRKHERGVKGTKTLQRWVDSGGGFQMLFHLCGPYRAGFFRFLTPGGATLA